MFKNIRIRYLNKLCFKINKYNTDAYLNYLYETNDIRLLDYKQPRSMNDTKAKLCEKLICNMINTRDERMKIVLNEFDNMKECKLIGGRSKSYDMEVVCDDNIYSIELKVIRSKEPPQLADIYVNSSNFMFNNNSFTESWYEYLLELKEKLNVKADIPKIQELEKNIFTIGNRKCKFLEELKAINVHNDIINQTAKKHIHEYIENHYNSFNISQIEQFYNTKLSIKDYIIIYNGVFNLIKIDKTPLKIIGLEKQKDKKSIYNVGIKPYFSNNKSAIIRLRWKNGNGLYGPSYKCGFLK